MRLVLGIDIAAKGFALGIEYDGDIAVLIAFYETAYHIDDTLDCTGRLPLAAHKWRQCMKGAKQIRGSVDKN